MAKRSIKRKSGYKFPTSIDDVDFKKIDTSLWDKMDIQDPMDVQDRTITIGRKNIAWDRITSDLQDTANNTSQFVKIINAHLKDKKSHIRKIVDLADNFEKQIQILKSDNVKISQLSDTPIQKFKSSKYRKLVQELLIDREKRIEIIKKLKNDLFKAEEELRESNKKIESINEKILEDEFEK